MVLPGQRPWALSATRPRSCEGGAGCACGAEKMTTWWRLRLWGTMLAMARQPQPQPQHQQPDQPQHQQPNEDEDEDGSGYTCSKLHCMRCHCMQCHRGGCVMQTTRRPA